MSFGGYKPDYVCMIDGLFNQTSLKYLTDAQLREKAEIGFNNETFLDVCDVNGTECYQFHFFGVKRTVISEVGETLLFFLTRVSYHFLDLEG